VTGGWRSHRPGPAPHPIWGVWPALTLAGCGVSVDVWLAHLPDRGRRPDCTGSRHLMYRSADGVRPRRSRQRRPRGVAARWGSSASIRGHPDLGRVRSRNPVRRRPAQSGWPDHGRGCGGQRTSPRGHAVAIIGPVATATTAGWPGWPSGSVARPAVATWWPSTGPVATATTAGWPPRWRPGHRCPPWPAAALVATRPQPGRGMAGGTRWPPGHRRDCRVWSGRARPRRRRLASPPVMSTAVR